jgi:hypothetical protein
MLTRITDAQLEVLLAAVCTATPEGIKEFLNYRTLESRAVAQSIVAQRWTRQPIDQNELNHLRDFLLRKWRVGDVSSEDSQNKEARLLDQLARYLATEAFQRNTLSHENLRRLRQILLTPEEFASFADVIKNEQRCATCGVEFRTEELLTFSKVLQGNTPISLICSRCMIPRHVRCMHANCTNTDRVPAGIMQRYLRYRCPAHRGVATFTTSGPEETDGSTYTSNGSEEIPF